MALLPPDARAERDFRIIKGTDSLIRTDKVIDAGVASLEVGEFVVVNATNKVVKATGATLAAPAQNTACCWTKYAKNDPRAGQSDAVATGHATLISGPYHAKTKFFESTGTFTAGHLLVVRASTTVTGLGVLDAVAPASATTVQLAAAIGKVVSLSNGVLTYRTLGEA